MDQRGFFIGLISAYLQGTLERATLAQLVAGAFGNQLPPEYEPELLRYCERILQNPKDLAGAQFARELRYCLECLNRERVFDPERPYRRGHAFPVIVHLRFSRGILARVHRVGPFLAVALTTRDPALLPDFEKLQNATPFLEMLRWCRVNPVLVARKPFYFVPVDRRLKFIRELKILIELHFPGV